MKNFKYMMLMIAALISTPALAELDSDSATVYMNVASYAALTDLDDFVLATNDADGSAGAQYNGSDEFHLESNSQVRVSLSGGDLSNGTDSVTTDYALDGAELEFDTASNSTHNGLHTVSASTVLGDISEQQAGGYSAEITLTVSAL